jgi:hypothetical protein
MEEIHYKKRLEDLSNRQLDIDFQNAFLGQNTPEEIDEHLEIVHYANPEDRVEPAESRNILFNYMQNSLENEQPIARRRLRGGKRSKKRKSRKTRKGRKSRRIRRR